ncbi:MAG: DUF4440 domain-containing protein [Pyrinomonadaceae bacterium]
MKILISFLIILTGISSAFSQSPTQQARIADEIRGVMTAQSAAWNRGDIEGFMKGYWRSDRLIFVSGVRVTRGWQPTLEMYRKSYDTRAKMGTLTFSDLEFHILSPGAAVVLGSWALKREKDEPNGKFTLTFKKLGRNWRIVIDHTS